MEHIPLRGAWWKPAASADRIVELRGERGTDETRRARQNPIVAWLLEQGSLRDYLDYLCKVDRSLAESLQETFRLKDARRRLALTLFIDYACRQRLSPGEVALLLGDAQTACRVAAAYLISNALREPGRASGIAGGAA